MSVICAVNEVTNHRSSIENTIPHSRSPMVIGKPAICQDIDTDLDAASACQVRYANTYNKKTYLQ